MKSLLQMLLLTAFLSVCHSQKAAAAGVLKIIPGKSLGAVSLGENREKLIDEGFGPDGATDPQEYLQMSGVLVRLKNDKVAQIYADSKALKRIRFKGKKLPKDTTAKALKKFFQNCGKQIKTSAGILMYCEHHGIELTYHSMKGKLEGLAIVSAKPVKGKKGAKSETRALPKKVVKKAKKTSPKKAEAPVITPAAPDEITPVDASPAAKQAPKEQPAVDELDEQSLEKDIDAMPSQPDSQTPPAVAPADTPAESSSAAPTGKELEKANDLPYED